MKNRPEIIPAAWRLIAFLVVPVAAGAGLADEPTAALLFDRAAIERVYHHHRRGEKPPFEQALPPATLENLVRQDMRKEAALKQAYRVEVTPALIDAEVQRINTTTRAPELLAELKAALGNDPARFARALARPRLVERLLREKFEHDDALHARQRREMERVRTLLTNAAAAFRSPDRSVGLRPNGSGHTDPRRAGDRRSEPGAPTNGLAATLLNLLQQTHPNDVSETTWQLGARPAAVHAPNADELEIKRRFGTNAQLFPPALATGDQQRTPYFEDLPPELQRVLRAQLHQPGDVSAVIEMPGGFVLFLATETTAESRGIATLAMPKRSYEQWLNEPGERQP